MECQIYELIYNFFRKVGTKARNLNGIKKAPDSEAF